MTLHLSNLHLSSHDVLHRQRYRWGLRTVLLSLCVAASWGSPLNLRWQAIPVAFETATAYAQTVTNEEVRSYAEAVLEMDDNRLTAYTQVSDILTSQGLDVTDYNLSCPNAQTLTDVPRQVRSRIQSVLVDYCNAARAIVEESGLTVGRFNAITDAHREDEELAQRIKTEISTIQQPE
ncbi:MAG: DUF4168 domain-containing protein [Cyanobacteria bacterium P01_A01_bin.114]